MQTDALRGKETRGTQEDAEYTCSGEDGGVHESNRINPNNKSVNKGFGCLKWHGYDWTNRNVR
ncbi:hypothetical protein PISMIDRAFT_686701 [Pisolithus microcarpus 441]|uniref:Uncharacterized protein n=1 Tax=Pisolithus microcarpus 441 TaxID=765257 RepID=A0A0C9Z865_9AGAM|nr:hypothetical protein BKA83DRAFT_686701 [Pisolithus microcarpus]KIK16038.1 hypothetical protein PISMIDRAFT_686701 [Pisolithus microcarpus 441]